MFEGLSENEAGSDETAWYINFRKLKQGERMPQSTMESPGKDFATDLTDVFSDSETITSSISTDQQLFGNYCAHIPTKGLRSSDSAKGANESVRNLGSTNLDRCSPCSTLSPAPEHGHHFTRLMYFLMMFAPMRTCGLMLEWLPPIWGTGAKPAHVCRHVL